VRAGETAAVRPLADRGRLVHVAPPSARPGERLGLRIFQEGAGEPVHDVLLDAVEPGVFELRAELAQGPHRFEMRLGAGEAKHERIDLLPASRAPLVRLWTR
jgi:hypothetical protein